MLNYRLILYIKTYEDLWNLIKLILEIELSKIAVELKQTYGFPIEITSDLVNEKYKGELKLLPKVIKFYEDQHKERSRNNKFKQGFKVINS